MLPSLHVRTAAMCQLSQMPRADGIGHPHGRDGQSLSLHGVRICLER